MTPQTMRVMTGIICLSLWSCAWGGTTMTVPIKEASIASVDNVPPRWLDNTHVLVRAFAPGRSPQDRPIYVWDIDRGTATQDPRFRNGFPGINPETGAFTSGSIRYKNYEDKKGNPLPPAPPGTCFNPVDGHPCTTNPPPWMVNGHTSTSKVPLKEEHGYLDRGIDGQDTRKNFPILYYRTGIAEPIALGLGSQQVEPGVKYYPFVQGYLLRGERAGNAAPPLWVLHPDGTLDKIFDPEGKPWIDNQWSWLMLTKRGVIFVLMNLKGRDDVKDSGLYLWEGGALTRLVSGVFDFGSVSPDGCHVAVVYDRWRSSLPFEERYRIQAIDVCHGGPHVH